MRTRLRVAFRFLPNCLPPKQKEDYSLSSLLTKKSSYRALIRWRLERVNEIAKPLGENLRAKFPVMRNTGRSDVMLEESTPSFP